MEVTYLWTPWLSGSYHPRHARAHRAEGHGQVDGAGRAVRVPARIHAIPRQHCNSTLSLTAPDCHSLGILRSMLATIAVIFCQHSHGLSRSTRRPKHGPKPPRAARYAGLQSAEMKKLHKGKTTRTVALGLDRIVALHHRPSTPYQIH